MSTPKKLVDEDESRRIRVQIRHVLLNVWDPIGVADEPNAQNEYDSHVGPIYDLIVARNPDAALIEYLHLVTTVRMGFTATESDMLNTVESLRKIPIHPAHT